MRLRVSRNSAQERITALLVNGHTFRDDVMSDYRSRLSDGSFSTDSDIPRYRADLASWISRVSAALDEVFPTALEALQFRAPASHAAVDFIGMSNAVGVLYHQQWPMYLARLDQVLSTALDRYTDLPLKARLFIEDVDSFAKVRDVNPAMVATFLTGGYLDISEERVQLALERILSVATHQKDWGGERNDLHTANVMVNGQRRVAAFLLKGPGIGRKEMQISDCGKNGDQVLRLFESPADLFVIQYVGPIAQAIVLEAESKTDALRADGRSGNYLIVDGQDTARLLHAYGALTS